jgi:hypothetical protein
MGNAKIAWSVDSRETLDFCKKIGFDVDIHFVETAIIDGLVFVRGNAGHEHEFQLLKSQCNKFAAEGYVYWDSIKQYQDSFFETKKSACDKYFATLLNRELDNCEEYLFDSANRYEVESKIEEKRKIVAAQIQEIKALHIA